jgi:hypothetical protein
MSVCHTFHTPTEISTVHQAAVPSHAHESPREAPYRPRHAPTNGEHQQRREHEVSGPQAERVAVAVDQHERVVPMHVGRGEGDGGGPREPLRLSRGPRAVEPEPKNRPNVEWQPAERQTAEIPASVAEPRARRRRRGHKFWRRDGHEGDPPRRGRVRELMVGATGTLCIMPVERRLRAPQSRTRHGHGRLDSRVPRPA